MKNLFSELLFIILIVCQIIAKPQLNLPSLTQNTHNTRPEVYSYSYTPKSQNDYYDDRSQRFGPPYNDEDFRPNDDKNQDYFSQNNNFSKNVLYNEDNSPNRFSDSYYPLNRFPQQFRVRNSSRTFLNDRYNLINNYTNNQIFNDGYLNGRNNFDPFHFDERRPNAYELEKIKSFLDDADYRGSTECTANIIAQWNFETDVNEITQVNALLAQQKYSDFQKKIFEEIKQFKNINIFEENLYRQLQLLSKVGPSALPPDQLDRYNRLINDMLAIYNDATVCAYDQPFTCDIRLNPDLKEIMAKSRDWDELQHFWTEFRRKSGKPMRDIFEQLVDLMNDVAIVNNFTNAGEYWLSSYEIPFFRDEVENIWSQIQPLYELIHAYVRRKLREYYGPDKINRNAPIPSHILGNIYAQTWTNIIDLTIPYPGHNFIDVTPKMLEQGYNPLIMFQLAEEFFLSLNMTPLPPDFWINSIIERPLHRPILCQPSAWDFCNQKDFRIKMCTEINHKDLLSVHHEMTHIQYFLNYKHLPKVYRDGANPGFHEALGNAVVLSVTTPKHLQTLGLVQRSLDDTAYDINFLLAMAFEKVVFLPFALSLEAWRYDIFSKRIKKEEMNCHYWFLREQYSGIKPPVLRSEMDFDLGAKYHIAANVPYMKYFVSTILQFQIYRAMCRASRQYDPSDSEKPLHKCNVYRQAEAGKILRKLMEKGASQPWHQVLEEVIGEDRLDGSALRDYFRPLEEWLRNENLRNQEFIGWIYDGDYCKKSIETANLQVYGGFYNNCLTIRPQVFSVFIFVIAFLIKAL